MSRRCVGYEGERRARRPVYADEGPSAANSGDGLASLSRLSAFGPDVVLDVDRSIERRQITAAEIAARARESKPEHLTRESSMDFVGQPGRSHVSDAERTQASRQRGARRHVEVIAASKPVPVVPVADVPLEGPVPTAIQNAWNEAHIAAEEPTVSEAANSITETIPVADPEPNEGPWEPVLGVLNVLSGALLEALAARDILVVRWEAYQEAEDRWERARRGLGDAYMALEAEAPYHELPDPDPNDIGVPTPAASDPPVDERLLARARAASLVEKLARDATTDSEPTTAPVTPSRPMRPSERRVLDALIRAAGDRGKVATELDQKRGSIDAAVARLRSRHDLTAVEQGALTRARA